MPSKKTSTCPYLSHNADCLMTTGGLYLPMPEHIETFCKKSSYDKCHYYIIGCEEIRNVASRVEGGIVNRRHYRRVQERLSLVLAGIAQGDGGGAEIFDDSAYTFDVSMGGVGFVSRCEILPKTKVAFTLGNRASGSSLAGAGVVQWTERNSVDPELFFSGLSFVDRKCQQAIGRRLWTS